MKVVSDVFVSDTIGNWIGEKYVGEVIQYIDKWAGKECNVNCILNKNTVKKDFH